MKTKLFVCAALLAVALFPVNGLADGKKGSASSKGQRIFAELGVTQEQEAKLKEIHLSASANKKVLMKQLDVLREQVKVELLKEKPSQKTLDKLAADIGNRHKQISQLVTKTLLQTKAVLTPEQFAKLSQRGLLGGPDNMKMFKHGGDPSPHRKGQGDVYRGKQNIRDGKGPRGQGMQGLKCENNNCPYERKRGPRKDAGGLRPSEPGAEAVKPAEPAAPPSAPVPIAPPIGTLPEGAKTGESGGSGE